MWEDTSDVIKVASVILAILIPIIGVYFMFRREISKANAPPSVGPAGLFAIAGGLTSRDGMKDYIQALHEQAEATRDLAKVNREGVEEISRAARALEEIRHNMRIRD